MTRPFNTNKLQFYMTLPTPCPYLPGRQERKIFTQLEPMTGPHLNNYLTHSGFRRSQNVLYRPACENCQECRSLRVCTPEFKPTKSMKRVSKTNQDLTRTVCEGFATNEQFELLQDYLHNRHPDGGMADMDYARYEMMVEQCVAETEIVEYRTQDEELIACALIDVLTDGFSMVYSFYASKETKRGLGNFMILDHIQRCREEGQPWLYLGYWVAESQKMQYKSRYQPCQILGSMGWENFEG